MTKRIRIRAGATCVPILLALLVASTPAAAKPKPITGKLSKPGYTVIALAAGGKATSVIAKHRKFRLRPPAKRVTLQLRAKDGTYAGPIVTGGKGKRAIVGVKAGAKLGKVKVKAQGYAKLARALPRKWADPRRWARAKKGVPIGAGKFGRVRSRHAHGGAPGDSDLDGIPNALDIDDDGDLILDNLDRSSTARASQSPEGTVGLHSELPLPLEDSVNANAPGLTDQQIEAALPKAGRLLINILPGDSAELDCGGTPNPSPPPPLLGGLAYCSTGGTGRVFEGGVIPADWPPFPDCCDPDGDGFGSLTQTPQPAGPAFFLSHGASAAQIRTGDLLIERVTTGGVESQFTATVPFVFATTPALVSYSDTAGDSGTVSYPVAPPVFGMGGGPGTTGNGFPVSAGTDGDVVLTLTYWRPQRRPIPPETGQWIDMGGLTYGMGVRTPASSAPGPVNCPQSAYSSTDPNLTPAPADVAALLGGGALTDLASDQPASPANTFTFKLNVTQCLASQGFSWSTGQEVALEFMGRSGAPDKPDNTHQNVIFKRQP